MTATLGSPHVLALSSFTSIPNLFLFINIIVHIAIELRFCGITFHVYSVIFHSVAFYWVCVCEVCVYGEYARARD